MYLFISLIHTPIYVIVSTLKLCATDLLVTINYDRLFFSAQFNKTLNNILQVGLGGYDLLYFKISFEIVVNTTFENIGTVIF